MGQASDPTSLNSAVHALANGGVIAYPTEAVFGLGCNPDDAQAMQRIIDIKGRDAHKGFILIASEQSQLLPYIAPITDAQQSQLDEHWPGPVTFVVPAAKHICNTLLTGFRSTLAVRVSSHPVVVELCKRYGGAVVSTSANRSGDDALRTTVAVMDLMAAEIDVVVDSPVGDLASPTRIFDLLSGKQLR